jgi:hypothetical protein
LWHLNKALFLTILLCSIICGATNDTIGYRVSLFKASSPLTHTYDFIVISPTRDGKVHFDPSMKVDYSKDFKSEAKKWVEEVLLRIQGRYHDELIQKGTMERGSQLHQDLLTKESILDGRTAVIAMFERGELVATVRLSFAGESIGKPLLPAEIRAPGGARDLFGSDSTADVTEYFNKDPAEWKVRGEISPEQSRANRIRAGLKSDRFSSYFEKTGKSPETTPILIGGRPAELKALLHSSNDADLDLLPTLFFELFQFHILQTTPYDLGIPVPTRVVSEATQTLYDKIYRNWGYSLMGQVNDPTLKDPLVYIEMPDRAFGPGRLFFSLLDRVFRPIWRKERAPVENYFPYVPNVKKTKSGSLIFDGKNDFDTPVDLSSRRRLTCKDLMDELALQQAVKD